METPVSQPTIHDGIHSLNSEQRRQQSHELDIPLPSGDLPMVDSKDIEDFFTGMEKELDQREAVFINNPVKSDPLLSSAGVHTALTPNPENRPPPPYPGTAHTLPLRDSYPNTHELHDAAWQNHEKQNHYRTTATPVGNPPPYQAPLSTSRQDLPPTDLVHSNKGGSRIEPEFEHNLEDDFGPRRVRPESPRVDSQKQLLKWQEDEKLGAMATISPVLYANLSYPKLHLEYPGMLGTF